MQFLKKINLILAIIAVFSVTIQATSYTIKPKYIEARAPIGTCDSIRIKIKKSEYLGQITLTSFLYNGNEPVKQLGRVAINSFNGIFVSYDWAAMFNKEVHYRVFVSLNDPSRKISNPTALVSVETIPTNNYECEFGSLKMQTGTDWFALGILGSVAGLGLLTVAGGALATHLYRERCRAQEVLQNRHNDMAAYRGDINDIKNRLWSEDQSLFKQGNESRLNARVRKDFEHDYLSRETEYQQLGMYGKKVMLDEIMESKEPVIQTEDQE